MLKYNFLMAWRLLLSQKIYSTVNIFGLTTGVTAALLILLYVADELSYDRFHPDADRIYRVTFHGRLQGEDINSAQTGLPLAEAIQREGTGIESTLRIDKWMTCPVQYEEKAFTEMYFYLADSNFFSFFNFKLLEGNPQEALKGPHKVVISQDAALRYFNYKGKGDPSPIGKTMVIGSTGDVTAEVTGIVQNPPLNAHLRFDFLMSLENSGYIDDKSWLSTMVYTYFKLLPGTDIANMEKTFDTFIRKYGAGDLQRGLNVTLEEFLQQGGDVGFKSQAMTDIHLRSHLNDELEPNGNLEYVYLFSAIAGFILLLACINFMNLATARSAKRAKEIGVRKTVGALRGKLIGQFLTESFLYSIIAFGLSLVLVTFLRIPFNMLSGKELSTEMLLNPSFLAGFIMLLIIIGFLSGSYPAFYLTSFRPMDVLKGKARAGRGNSRIRNGLVIFQFFISIALIISSIMVFRQLSYLQQQSVGFQKENVVGLMHTMNLGKDAEPLKNEILSYPEFVAASYASRLPPNVDMTATFRTETGEENFLMAYNIVDHDHQKTLGLEMVSGRFFSHDFRSDSSAVIINETAARRIGYQEGQVNKLRFSGNDTYTMEIIGVVKDFNFESLKTTIRPLALVLGGSQNWGLAVRLSPGNPGEKISLLQKIWRKYMPNSPFEYSFVDETFAAKFRAEERLANVIFVFTLLAVFIACLGLFGLATFAAEQRSREISIRKVMGASVVQLVVLLSKDLSRLVLVAFIIAIPVAWYGMDEWLKGFAYRIDFSLFIALWAGAIALLIAILTISYQAVKVSMGNPVNALKAD